MALDMHPEVKALLTQLQPGAAVYGGGTISNSTIGWGGAESGHYPKMYKSSEGFWSTGGHETCRRHCNGSQCCQPVDPGALPANSNGQGVPGSPYFIPKSCDTYLAKGGWFYHSDGVIKPRLLADLISVYHGTVGRNCVLELDFAINRQGLVEPTHAKQYAALGAWIRACYGTPLAATNGSLGGDQLTLSLGTTAAQQQQQQQQPRLVDRVVIQEQLELGQRIRNFTVEAQQAPGGPWLPFGSGESVGHKRILLLTNRTVVALRLTVTARMASALAPMIANFAAFAPCDDTGLSVAPAAEALGGTALKSDDAVAVASGHKEAAIRESAAPAIAFNYPRRGTSKQGGAVRQDVPFGSSMVLQRGPLRARIWGTATAGNTTTDAGTGMTVSVQLLSAAGGVLASASTAVTANGTWAVALPPLLPTLKATLVASMSTSGGGEARGGGSEVSARLTDIAVGDVYLCSGQVRSASAPPFFLFRIGKVVALRTWPAETVANSSMLVCAAS